MGSEKSVMAVIRASRPSFRNSNDKVAFVVHASFLASGYVLTATGPPAFSDNPLSSSSSSDEVGIDHWNEVEDEYAFIYVNPDKGNKKVLVKCLVMGDMMMVDALSGGGSTPVHLEIDVGEYVAENAGNDYTSQYKNLGKLVTSIQSEILSKLDGASTGTTSTSSVPRSRAAEEPTRNYDEPDYSSENPTGFVVPPVNPIGGSDLFPGPGAGVYPSRGDFGGGSMLVGPHDSRWFGDRGGWPGNSGGLGVPPGARFDPYGPPGVPGFEPGPGRFPRGPFPDTGVDPDIGPVPGRAPRGRLHPDLEQPGSGGFDYI